VVSLAPVFRRGLCGRALLTLVVALVVLAALVRPRAALADSKQECSDAYQKTQVLRAADKIEEALAQADICTRTCAKAFRDECASWRADLEARTATIIVEAIDATGVAVKDGSASLDGVPWLDELGGPARVVSKGPHTLEIAVEGVPSQKKAIVIREGEKGRTITITIPAKAPPDGASEPHRTGPWVVGGVGVATLIAGAVTGGFVVDAYSVTREECNDEKEECSQPGLDAQARGRLLGPVTTGLLIGGGTLVAAGVVWLIVAPSAPKPSAASVFLVPAISMHEGGVVLGGRW